MTLDAALDSGVLNMLFGCGQVSKGGKILIIHESEAEDYYDATISAVVETTARRNALQTELIEVGFEPAAKQIEPSLYHKMASADLTVFLARLGDQVRFQALPEGTNAVISYVLNITALASPFATAPHEAFARLKSCIDAMTIGASHVHITCPNGTDVVGHLALEGTPLEDVGLRRFPISVAAPVPATGFSGRVALCGFLTGTGATYYDPYSCLFSEPVFALLDNGRLVGFEGSAADVLRANAHYDHVSGLCGVDRNIVHSWHAGIHPACAYPTAAMDHLLRWGGSAFGNPRLLHFHTCGANAPGEISWNVLDPTIEFDGVAVWQAGRLFPERVAGGAEILAEFPEAKSVFDAPDRRVGL